MTRDEFSAAYRLLKSLTDTGVRSYNALETATGDVVMVHLMDRDDTETVFGVDALIDGLPAEDRARVLVRDALDGHPFLVTRFLPGFTTLKGWLASRAQERKTVLMPALPRPDGATASASARPAAPTAPSPAPSAPPAVAPASTGASSTPPSSSAPVSTPPWPSTPVTAETDPLVTTAGFTPTGVAPTTPRPAPPPPPAAAPIITSPITPLPVPPAPAAPPRAADPASATALFGKALDLSSPPPPPPPATAAAPASSPPVPPSGPP
nr:hypothetical protein [Gemmatimonadaceae bacterium]